MTMNRDALMALQAMLNLESSTAVDLSGVMDGATPYAVLPDNMNLESLEKFLPAPVRFREKYSTSHLEAFCAYVIEMVDDQCNYNCFVNPEQMNAVIAFDAGTPMAPGFGEHRAKLALRATPQFSALREACDRPMRQEDFAQWLEDWRDCITALDNDENVLDFRQVVQAVRKFTVNATGNLSHETEHMRSSKSALSRVEVENREKLPVYLNYVCAPYDGLSLTHIPVRMRVSNLDDEPKFMINMVSRSKLEFEIGSDFSQILESDLDAKNIDVLIGSVER